MVGSLNPASTFLIADEVFNVIRKPDKALQWQSKAILLLVVPWTVASVILQAHWWFVQEPTVAWQSLGISVLFGLIVWRLKAATPAGAATGAAITASLMFSTARYPYRWSWLHGGLVPLLTVFLLTYVATKIGKAKKERIGTGESRRGRNAAQVAANLGAAALVATVAVSLGWERGGPAIFVSPLAIAALAEAAADTISSEIGQVLGGQPRMFITFRRVEIGTDGGVTLLGTAAGALAATVVAAAGTLAIASWSTGGGAWDWFVFTVSVSGAIFGLLFDSLLGATLERKGLLNNDAVNFLSTAATVAISAAAGILLFGIFLRV